MGRKAFCVPALVTSFIACFLLLLCTISTPTTFHTSTPFNFVEARNLGNLTDVSSSDVNSSRNISGIKLGSWGYCTQRSGQNDYDDCSPNHHEYNVTLRNPDPNNQAGDQQSSITKGWTRGLVTVVVAFVVAVIGFILSFIPHLLVMLIASFVHLLAFIIALVAFIIQIVLYVHTRSKINDITTDASIIPGPGFYLTLISLPLLFFSALTVCCGWRKEKSGSALPSSYGGGAYGSSSLGSKFSDKFSFGRKSNKAAATQYGADYSSYSAARSTADTTNEADAIPMQTSRQRVLDAFHNDNKQ